jgi:hypothetical protein
MDPIELRLKNYAKVDPDNNKQYSSKYLDEAYAMGAERIGWRTASRSGQHCKMAGWLATEWAAACLALTAMYSGQSHYESGWYPYHPNCGERYRPGYRYCHGADSG